MNVNEISAGFEEDTENHAKTEMRKGSYEDRLTAALWKAYTGYDFDPHTVKIMCELRGVAAEDAITRALMEDDEE